MDKSVKVTNEVLSFVQLLRSKTGAIKLPAHLPLLRGLEFMAVQGDSGYSVIRYRQKNTALTYCLHVLDLLKLPKTAAGARQALIGANLWTETEMNDEDKRYQGDKNPVKFGEVR